MVFAVQVREDGVPVRWATDGEGATATSDPDYEPALLAAARGDDERYLSWLAEELSDHVAVTGIEWVRRYRDLAADERSRFLRIAVSELGSVRDVARSVRRYERRDHAPGVVSLYDVDLDPGFRYCLDTGTDPTPGRDLRRLSLSLSDPALAADDPTRLRVDGERVGDTVDEVREAVRAALAGRDPDVLALSSADLVPLLSERGVDLGRRPGYRTLAGEHSYVSEGRVGHSPARYAVPGRVLLDRSNGFLLGKSGLAGVQYLVERSGKPLQEVAHDSIGGVLTAIEVREARERGVPAPWQKRQTEGWKSVETLEAADRGGFTFQPDPGVHEDVVELDFASLYPNVIREYNVSPETVDCDCHDGADVPELGYSLCPEPGFLGDVLGPLLDDRAGWKAALRDSDPGTDTDALRAKVDAVKWVRVSCFGSQGFRHAKFGRIEVHESINAVARELMLRAKAAVEAAGWRIVHGIVDSLWVTPDPAREQVPARTVAGEVSADVGIDLEYEGRFDWVAFCPRKRAGGAALMRYFGRWADPPPGEDRYEFRGIEARQRSTSAFVADAQETLVAVFDRERDPEAVCDRLAEQVAVLRADRVDPRSLTITQRVSKPAADYRQSTRTKAALERTAAVGVPRSPGQSVEYVVVDDDAAGPGRVRLAFEEPSGYDAAFYVDRLIRACESVLSPLGWDRDRIRRSLASTRETSLDAFGSGVRR